MCRRRFNPASVASSDGNHIHLLHDRRANLTGRSPYQFLGHKVIITDNSVYLNGTWIGWLHIDHQGEKWVYGPRHKGPITTVTP